MKYKRLASYLLGFLLLYVCVGHVSNTAYACRCKISDNPLRELEKSSAVFSGKVVKVADDGNRNLVVEFIVHRIWKGRRTRSITVRTPRDGATCGFRFIEGGNYLVYATGEVELWTNSCTRTRDIRSATEDLKVLGKGEKPKQRAT